MALITLFAGPATHRTGWDGGGFSLAVAATEPFIAGHWHGHLHHFYVHQPVHVLHNYHFDLRPHVAALGRVRRQGHWADRDRLYQCRSALCYLRRGALLRAQRADDIPEEAADGGAELDEHGRPDGD